MSDLSGKIVLMLGGDNVLSQGISQRLAEAGAKVAQGHELGLNLDDPAVLTGQIAGLGMFHAAVISPGWMAFGAFLETSTTDWQDALLCNFEQATYAAQAAARSLIAQGNGGRIIFVSSVGALNPLSRASVVGTTLSALHVLARMAAVDLAPYGITVNVVASGWIEADWNSEYLSSEAQSSIDQGIPLGRVCTPADVADVCGLLISDQANYLTGTIIPADGGYLLTPG